MVDLAVLALSKQEGREWMAEVASFVEAHI
jgi:hypothetical protein